MRIWYKKSNPAGHVVLIVIALTEVYKCFVFNIVKLANQILLIKSLQ